MTYEVTDADLNVYGQTGSYSEGKANKYALEEITDENKQTMSYSVYTKYEVVPEDVSCLDQKTNGRKEITLITCTDDSQKRVIVKARGI